MTVTVCLRASTSVTRSPSRARTCASSPHSGGGWAPGGGGGDVRLHGLEQVPDEALGGPADQADAPAGAGHADELVGGLLVVGREHHADARQHGVEGVVGVGQRLGVGLLPAHRHALALRERPPGGEELRGEVGGHDVGAGERGGHRDVPGARGDVQHPLAGADPGRGDEDGAELRDEAGGHVGVVAQAPHRAVLGLESAVGGGVGDGLGHRRSPSSEFPRGPRTVATPMTRRVPRAGHPGHRERLPMLCGEDPRPIGTFPP